MGKRLELTGERFGKLIVQESAGVSKTGRFLWNCECDCGNTKTVSTDSLRSGKTKSCGCLRKEITTTRNSTHGQAKRNKTTREYNIWRGMIQRCNNPNSQAYKNYGGRGISVCSWWMIFDNFYEDVGKCPDGMTIDRKDNNGNYEPGNVRWATTKEQNNNYRRNIWITYQGKTKNLTQWAHSLGVDVGALHLRLKRGWSIERTLTTPIWNNGRKSCVH
jgi:hypothetical protein